MKKYVLWFVFCVSSPFLLYAAGMPELRDGVQDGNLSEGCLGRRQGVFSFPKEEKLPPVSPGHKTATPEKSEEKVAHLVHGRALSMGSGGGRASTPTPLKPIKTLVPMPPAYPAPSLVPPSVRPFALMQIPEQQPCPTRLSGRGDESPAVREKLGFPQPPCPLKPATQIDSIDPHKQRNGALLPLRK
ncbi:hypothetical protein OAN22_01745 [Alphaproteobacteria bacterium]|nr:hypothetical protein [Alphaproteobacteria bacterium]